jgi:hypothetical protein
MPSSMPDAPKLLAAAIKYLEDELMPELAGYHRFKCRVTANVLHTIRRELELRDEYANREHGRLRGLLGHDAEVKDLTAELAAKIRTGEISPENPALRQHIRESVKEALAINNPRWLTGKQEEYT